MEFSNEEKHGIVEKICIIAFFYGRDDLRLSLIWTEPKDTVPDVERQLPATSTIPTRRFFMERKILGK